MSYEFLHIDRDGGLLFVALNRPKRRNALNTQMARELEACLQEAERDPSIGVLVLSGAGDHFCAGADIDELRSARTLEFFLNDPLANARESVARFRKPVIAQVRGYALGGGFEIALMCDMIVADSSARFGLPEITIGTMPGAGGTQRLARLVGRKIASELVLTGRTLACEDAVRLGIVNRCWPQDALAEETRKLAAEMAALSLPALMMAKEALGAADEVGLTAGLQIERRLFHASLSSPDLAEGAEAFLSRRPPRFNRPTSSPSVGSE